MVVVVVAVRWVAWAAATARWHGQLWGAQQCGACGDEGKVR